jgi:hypothetical protein
MAKQKRVYLLAALSSIILYVVGIFTGAFIYSFTESKTSQEFDRLHDEIESYGRDLEAIELEQFYLASGQSEVGCKFIVTSLNRVQSDLDYFWNKLPEKLEVYEKYNPPDESYESLKREYMVVSLKAWLLSLSVREKCGEGMLPILYFYSRDCETCIDQGYILDNIRSSTQTPVYTLDLNLESDAISMLREAYGISRAPALVIGENSYQGLVTYEELLGLLKKEGPKQQNPYP